MKPIERLIHTKENTHDRRPPVGILKARKRTPWVRVGHLWARPHERKHVADVLRSMRKHGGVLIHSMPGWRKVVIPMESTNPLTVYL